MDQLSLLPAAPAQQLVLRGYQQAAVNACYTHLRTRDDNPLIVIPTGGGKTPIIATISRDAVECWGGRVLVLAHVKELLQQAADKLSHMAPSVRFGVFSAGLGRRDKRQNVIIAGIQSVYQRAGELDAFDLILLDEAHLTPPEGDGMYQTFFADARKVNPKLRIVGLTATPFRMKSGSLCEPGGIFNSICYEVGVRQLIVEGYLSPLTSKGGKTRVDLANLRIQAGEFVASEVEQRYTDSIIESACQEVIEYTADRKAVLLFAISVEHGQKVCQAIERLSGQPCGFVTGDTLSHERTWTLSKFLSGNLKYLCNVNVLTTGFDAPHIDCVALLRPTNSPGLYYQMVGRGFRLSPGKSDCLVLDFGGNVIRHGPVDKLKMPGSTLGAGSPGDAPAKECPECQSLIAAGYSICPDCGYAFPQGERQPHDGTASDASVLSSVKLESYPVLDTYYSVHVKRGADEGTPTTMRVDYQLKVDCKAEWVCFEHSGFARQKAESWWAARSDEPVPATTAEAVAIANAGGLAESFEITVRHVEGEYDRVVGYKLGPKPMQLSEDDREEVLSAKALAPVDPFDDIPF